VKDDLTQPRGVEDALRETEARFRQIVEHIHEVIWMSAVDFSSMLYVSPGYEKIWGRSCESVRQDPRSWIEAIHAEDRDRVVAIVERNRTQGFSVEYPRRSAGRIDPLGLGSGLSDQGWVWMRLPRRRHCRGHHGAQADQ